MTTDTIYTLAAKLDKKPSKKVAFGILAGHIADPQNKPLDNYNLAVLYAFFLPPVPTTAKTPWDWIQKAVAVNDVRYYLNHCYSDGHRLIGTDGHRLHVWQTTDYAPGWYDRKGQPVTVDGKYPDVDRVIPKPATVNDYGVVAMADCRFDTCEKIRVIQVGPHGAWFNSAYIKDATFGQTEITCHQADKNSSLLIDLGDGCQAVVMPIRHEVEEG